MYGFIKNNRIIQVANRYESISGNIVVSLDGGRMNIGKESDIEVKEYNSLPDDWKYRDGDLNIVDNNYIVILTEKAIDDLIQSEIDTYNQENGVNFKGIDSMDKYNVSTYTHYDFVLSVLAWNVAVWEKSRELQIDIFSGVIDKPSSIQEFLELLPKRV